MTNPLQRTRIRLADERGAVAVIVALLMVVLLGSSAMLFDLARLRHERHVLQGAVDLGSLAGAGFLPVRDAGEAAMAEAAARDVAMANAPQLLGGGLSFTFGCVVSDPDNDGGDDSTDLKFACGPAGGGGWGGGWTSRGGKALHACNPQGGDLCNTITLTASNEIDYFFAPILGINSGNTGAVSATACKGYCGQPSSPLDVVFVLDRTGSMSPADIENLKDAIADPSPAEDSILEFYEPSIQRVGFVALPYHDPNDTCSVNDPQTYPNTSASAWQPVGSVLSDGYRNPDGSLNVGDPVVNGILCLQRAPDGLGVNLPGGHTNYGNPIESAASMLDTGDDIPDVIVVFADGQANQPSNLHPCQYAADRAASAKASGIIVFSLAYGVGNVTCHQDGTGFNGVQATTFLAGIASPDEQGNPSTDDAPGGCGPLENTVGEDNYFCEGPGEDLEIVFRQIAIAAITRTRLLNF